MGKFKFSKRAYLNKVKEKRDWEDREEEEGGCPDVNKSMRCHKFVSLDRDQKGTVSVEIKSNKCDSAYMCSARYCDFK